LVCGGKKFWKKSEWQSLLTVFPLFVDVPLFLSFSLLLSRAAAPRSKLPLKQTAMSGHGETFTESKEADIYTCVICTGVARDVVEHICGQYFCFVCWTQWEEAGNGCSHCKGAEPASPGHRARREILNLSIECTDEEKHLGCGKIFRLGDKDTHLANSCIHRSVPCDNCVESITPATQESHLAEACIHRTISCGECKEDTSPAKLPEHKKVCSHRLEHCVWCSELVKAKDLEQHLEASVGKHLLKMTSLVQDQERQLLEEVGSCDCETRVFYLFVFAALCEVGCGCQGGST
jgi:hypothetical protein